MKKWPIKHRVLFLAIFPVFAISLLLSSLLIYGGISEIDDAMKARGKAMARQLAPASEYGAFSGNFEILQGLVQAVMKEPDVKAVVITDAREKILAISGNPTVFRAGMADAVDDGRIIAGENGAFIFGAQIFQNAIEIDDFGLSDPNDRKVQNTRKLLGRLYIELSNESTQARKNRFILIGALIGLLGIAGAFLLALRMSRDVTNPLSHLHDAVMEMTRGNLDARVATGSGGELHQLENGFNQMATELGSARAAMQARIDEITALLDHKEKAEQASYAKTRFLASASHDLRQPVQALNWFVAALRQNISDEQSLRICQMMQESIRTLNELLERLLDISKLDAGVVAPQKEQVPVDSLLTRLENEFRALLEARGIGFAVHFSHVWVETDPNLLMMILRNLISNAAKYTDQGRIVLGCRRHGEELAIQVWDTGVGIPPLELRNIFQEFYQVGEQSRERRQGLGLGLAIVERIAKLLGHSINVRSTVGKGSLFEVRLPVCATPQVALAPSEEVGSPSQNRVVAILEDEVPTLEGLTFLLNGYGYVAVGEASVGELLESLSRQHLKPDIVVADYRLGDNQTGLRAINLLRDTFSPTLAAILITGDTTPERVREADTHRITLLHKPIDGDKLVFTIEKCLAAKRK
ncbi:MAG: HAMP domain-containing protein [Sulfuricella sp.]|nr:HAMP domain-containing protein [Sulfuricella sp.]